MIVLRQNPFTSERSTPLYQQLYAHLQTGILNGDLKPGTRLPSTRALAIQLNISCNPHLTQLKMAPSFGQELALSSYRWTCILIIQINCTKQVDRGVIDSPDARNPHNTNIAEKERLSKVQFDHLNMD